MAGDDRETGETEFGDDNASTAEGQAPVEAGAGQGGNGQGGDGQGGDGQGGGVQAGGSQAGSKPTGKSASDLLAEQRSDEADEEEEEEALVDAPGSPDMLDDQPYIVAASSAIYDESVSTATSRVQASDEIGGGRSTVEDRPDEAGPDAAGEADDAFSVSALSQEEDGDAQRDPLTAGAGERAPTISEVVTAERTEHGTTLSDVAAAELGEAETRRPDELVEIDEDDGGADAGASVAAAAPAPSTSDAETPSVDLPDAPETEAPPLRIALISFQASIDETGATGLVKVADVLTLSGSLPSGGLTLGGPNASYFMIDGTSVYLRPGMEVDFETLSTLSVTVSVIGEPSIAANLNVAVNDVNETASIDSIDTVASVAESVDTSARVELGEVSLLDDALGSNTLVLSGPDAALFEVDGTTLYLKPGVTLDYESDATLDLTVTVIDPGAVGVVATQSFSIPVADINEGPTDVALDAATVAENDAGAVIGNVSGTDPDAGDSLTYSVDDARFEIVGGQLKLKDGQSLDHETADTVTVNITATDSGGLTRTEAFTITVSDVNEGPTDVALDATTVAENDSGAVIGNVSGTDPDDGDSLTYSVDDARFEIVGGQLKLKDGQSLDHETADTVTVNITATDGDGLTRTEAFTISVSDVNEGPTDVALDATTVAENDAGAVIGNVTGTDPDDGYTLTYTVDDARFEIVGGQLKLKDGQSLDHETADTVTVNITATDSGGLTRTEAFTITVSDVNEGPTDVALDATTVAENDAGAVIGNVSGTDPDDGDSLTYSVDDARFEIVGGQLKLKDGQSLDHETADTVTVNISATDGDGATRTEAFTITVSDVNEGPTDVALDATTVAENDAGAVIGNVSGTDPDDGDTLTYSVDDARFEVVGGQLKLKDGQSLDHETADTVTVNITATDSGGLTRTEAFTITVDDVNEGPTDVALDATTVAENDSGAVIGNVSGTDPDDGDSLTYSVDDARFEIVGGQLKLKDGQSLDHETADTVTVNITATDGDGATRTEAFTITVSDVNEGPTDVALDATTVAENDAGAVIGNVSGTDPDDGDTLAYTVDDARFEVVGGQLKLKDGQSLDHETADTVTVNITATDSGGLTRTEAFTITVSDVNEGPTDVALDATTVAENDAGAVIGNVSGTDPDDGDSLTYSVDDARFEIVGGQLKLKDGQSLDHETADTVTVNITATDGDGATRTEAFTITVSDVNEGPTDVALDATTVAENDAGAVIGNVSGTDPDDGDSLTYTVDDARFEVVGGQLKLKDGQSLDHETADSVTVNITATDSGGLTRTEAFTITVSDVNEGPTDVALDATTVTENDSGAVIGNVSGTDPDDGDTLTYTVDDARFEVVGGQLKLKDGQSLDHETADTVTVNITATDNGGLTRTEAFTITVDDVNEGPTDVALDATTVAENDAGAVIGNVSGTDPDDGDTLTYSVDDARFEIVGGQLKLKDGQSLDHETADTVTVNITATDGDGATRTEAFTITVSDVNEGPTDVALDATTVAENDAGAVIGNISGTDPDDGDTLTYTVDDARFEVVGGQLKLKDGQSLDHETADSVTVNITATDSGGLTRTEAFTISVSDVNEGPTDVALDATTVTENDSGAVIGNVTGTDPDDGDSLTYSVDDARFEVVGGQLKLKDGQSLDFESGDVTVTITATDSQGATYDEAFTITVSDQAEAITLGDGGVTFTDTGVTETSVTGGSGDDVITGGAGDDVIAGGAGDDTIDGGAGGSDTVVFSGNWSDYTITENAGVYTVTGPDGTDTVTGVETFRFDDGDVAVADVLNDAPTDIALDATTVTENDSGAVIGNVTGTDPDAGDSLSYSVDDARFEVVGGQLKLKDGQSLDFESGDVTVTITATDSQGATYDEAFTITVSDQAEAITLGDGGVTFTDTGVTETSVTGGSGDDVITGGAGDDVIAGGAGDDTIDGGAGGSDTVVFSGNWSDYTITENAGVYTVTGPDGTDTVTGVETFRFDDGDVAVADVLNDAPTDIALDASTVVENDAGAVIGNVTGTDPDAGDSLSYSVDDARFEVVGGQLKLKDGQSLDHETADTVTVNITATDSHGATRVEAFTITVSDVNEGPTDIALDATSVTENDAGAVIGNVSGTDPDDGDSLTYTVDDARFEIVGGQLKLKDGQSLDYESGDVTVTVTATDSLGATYDEAFTITVGDVAEAITLGDGGVTFTDTGVTEISITGGSGDDTITGSDGDDLIYGGGGADTIHGGAGDDVIHDGAGAATIDGGEGSDTIYLHDHAGGVSPNTITDTGSTGTDTIILTGDNGDSFELQADFSAASGIEVIDGSTLSGEYIWTYGPANFDFTGVTLTNVDQIRGNANDDTITGSAGDDVIRGAGGDDTLDGGAGTADVAVFSGNWADYTITENAGTYTVVHKDGGSDGTDTLTNFELFRFADGDVAAADMLNLAPTDLALSNASVAEASAGAVVGSVTTTDGNANDEFTYVVDDARFEVVGGQLKLKDGVSLDYETDGSSVTVEVTVTDSGGETYAESFALTINDQAENLTLADGGATFTDTGVAETSITGGTGDDTITATGAGTVIDGGAGDDSLRGGAGDDTLSGGDGNDTIRVEQGADVIDGGDGHDVLDVWYSSDATIDLASGTITGGDADGSTVTGIEEVWGGSGADTIIGSGAAETLYGWNGDDTISGGAGDDALYGEVGDDTIHGDVAPGSWRYELFEHADGLSSLADAGFTANGGRDNTAGADATGHTDNLDPTGIGTGDTFGLKLTTTLVVNEAGDYTFQTFADDGVKLFLDGVEIVSDDGLHGEQTADSAPQTLSAGTYTLEVVYFENTGSETLDVRMSGPDTGNVMTSLAGYDGVYAETGDDSIYGGSGADVIDGGLGDDVIDAGSGDDVISSGLGNDTVDGGDGTDTIVFSGNWADYAITENAGTYTVVGPHGTTSVTDVETFRFADGDVAVADLLNVGPTDITVSGAQSVNETVADGGTIGSANDPAGDVVATLATTDGDALDVHSYAILSATDQDGTPLTIDGSFPLEIVGDQVRVKSGAAIDYETVSRYNLLIQTTDANGATYSETVAIDVTDYEGSGTGTAGNDTITGTSEEDSISAGDGDDVINGGDGDDTIMFGAGADTVYGGAGNDVIDDAAGIQTGDYQNYIDGGAGDDTIYAGGGADTVYGGEGDDTIHGEGGDDLLYGDAGNDTIYGGAGEDVITGGAGDDFIDGGSNEPEVAGVVLNQDGETGDYLSVSNFASAYSGSPASAFTVEIQFSSSSFPADGATLMSYATASQDNAFTIFATNNSSFGGSMPVSTSFHALIGGSSYTFNVDPNSYFDGEQHSLAVSWDRASGALNLYLDGALAASGTHQAGYDLRTGGTIVLGQEQDSLGGGFDTGQIFEGAYHDVRIWGEERSAAEIAANHDVKLSDPASEPTLFANWQMDGVAGGIEDKAGSEDLTVTGATDLTGADHAVFSGDASGYEISIDGSGRVVVTDIDMSDGDDGTDTLANIETIDFADRSLDISNGVTEVTTTASTTGTAGDDIMVGDSQVNTIDGGSGADAIFGGAGNDVLSGGAGDDLLSGGAGDDTLKGDGENYGDLLTSHSLAGNWSFSEASGAPGDSTSAGNDAVLQNGATLGADGPTEDAGAVSLDGSNDYVEIANDAGYELSSGSISLWFKADALSGDQAILSRDSSGYDGGGHLTIWLESNGELRVRHQSASDSVDQTTSGSAVSAGEWSHVVYTWGSGGTELFLNGQSVLSDATARTLAGNSEPFTLGASQMHSGDSVADSLQDYFDGSISKFSIMGDQLDSADATALYESGLAGGGNDTLNGGAGDDTLTGGAGDDTIIGGAGDDTAVFSGEQADYSLSFDGATGEWTITDGDLADGVDEGTDVLIDIEALTFADASGGFDAMIRDMMTGETAGTAGDDSLSGTAGDDIMLGFDGSDVFHLIEGDGNDFVHGGAGASWTDTISITGDPNGAVSVSGATATIGDWTMVVEEGGIESSDASSVTLSQDSSGYIEFDDGTRLTFQDIESVQWSA